MTTVALAMALSSCSSADNPKAAMKNTITQQQASERAERYVRDAVSALSPTAQLELSGRTGSTTFPSTVNQIMSTHSSNGGPSTTSPH
jgi:hypothetical protein